MVPKLDQQQFEPHTIDSPKTPWNFHRRICKDCTWTWGRDLKEVVEVKIEKDENVKM